MKGTSQTSFRLKFALGTARKEDAELQTGLEQSQPWTVPQKPFWFIFKALLQGETHGADSWLLCHEYSPEFSHFRAFLLCRLFIFKCILTWVVPWSIPHVSPMNVPHLLPGMWFEMKVNSSAQVLVLPSRQSGLCSTFQVPSGDLKACSWTWTQSN